MNVVLHVVQNKSGRRSAVPDAIAQSMGYEVSQQKRKLIEQGFGWAKSIGCMRQVMVRGIQTILANTSRSRASTTPSMPTRVVS